MGWGGGTACEEQMRAQAGRVGLGSESGSKPKLMWKRGMKVEHGVGVGLGTA